MMIAALITDDLIIPNVLLSPLDSDTILPKAADIAKTLAKLNLKNSMEP